jgi:hypothetical protein
MMGQVGWKTGNVSHLAVYIVDVPGYMNRRHNESAAIRQNAGLGGTAETMAACARGVRLLHRQYTRHPMETSGYHR